MKLRLPWIREGRIELTKTDIWLNQLSTTLRRLDRSSSSFGVSPDGKRNYNELFGYGEVLTYQDYVGMWARGGLARAIVEKLPKACWRDAPKIVTGDEDDPVEILQEEINILTNRGMFRALERADILNRIGNFSVLFLGVPDGQEPVLPVQSGGSFDDLYFRAFSFDGITLADFESDQMDPRFGQPTKYQVQTSPTRNRTETKDQSFDSIQAHWSRIVHMAEGALDSTIEGTPILQPGWNTLIDLFKFRGASAESFYRGSRQRTELRAADGAKIDKSDAGLQSFMDEVEAWTNGFQDWIRTEGIEAHITNPDLASPKDGFDICVEELAGIYSMPVRVLTGKGGGQFLGAEDRASWNTLVADRQLQECTPWLLRTLAILAEAGMLELPDDARVEWPVNPVLNESEEAEVTLKRATAINQVATAGSTIAGAGVDMESAYRSVGLENIEITEEDPDASVD